MVTEVSISVFSGVLCILHRTSLCVYKGKTLKEETRVLIAEMKRAEQPQAEEKPEMVNLSAMDIRIVRMTDTISVKRIARMTDTISVKRIA